MHDLLKKRLPPENGAATKASRWKSFWRWVMIAGLIVLLPIVGGVLFLKLDTKAAATFTDNVLRPLIGDDRVVALEKIFFNASDLVERLTYNNQGAAPAPHFLDQSAGNLPNDDLDLTPLRTNPALKTIPGEGVWKNLSLRQFPDREVMAETFLRSDPERPYSVTTLVQADMSVLRMGSVAGTKQPGGPVGKPGPGMVPSDIVASGNLVAAFDGGFQYKDGQFGMIVGETTYLPLKNDLGTLIGFTDGTLTIARWTGQPLGAKVAFVRQNCPMLITDGTITVTDERSRALWGRLASGTTDIFTWRSGIGLTSRGNLVFAVGNNLTPATLAAALQTAGARNAIQLDINPIWVRFNIFDPLGSGKYTSFPLTKELQDGSKQYLNGYSKDFFYLYKK